eukprot:s690_g31.t1
MEINYYVRRRKKYQVLITNGEEFARYAVGPRFCCRTPEVAPLGSERVQFTLATRGNTHCRRGERAKQAPRGRIQHLAGVREESIIPDGLHNARLHLDEALKQHPFESKSLTSLKGDRKKLPGQGQAHRTGWQQGKDKAVSKLCFTVMPNVGQALESPFFLEWTVAAAIGSRSPKPREADTMSRVSYMAKLGGKGLSRAIYERTREEGRGPSKMERKHARFLNAIPSFGLEQGVKEDGAKSTGASMTTAQV